MAYGYGNKFYVEPWEVASGAVISGASQMIYPNGTAEDTQLIGAFSSSEWGAMSYSCARQYIASGGRALRTSIYSGAVQHVSGGGYASDTKVIGGVVVSGTMVETSEQRISSGGVAVKTDLRDGSLQYIMEGGSSVDCSVGSGSLQMVNGGAYVSGAVILKGGTQQFFCKAILKGCVISGGVQFVRSGAITSDTICKGSGSQVIHKGGKAIGAIVSQKGQQFIQAGGIASRTILRNGVQLVSSGGIARTATLSSGGIQRIVKGGVASGATLRRLGKQYISAGGIARGTKVSSGGLMYVQKNGVASNASLLAGGSAIVSAGAKVVQLKAAARSVLRLNKGATASALTMQSGAILNLVGSATLAGANIFTGIKNNGNAGTFSLAKGARLTLNGGNNLAKTVVYGGAGTLVLSGTGNTLKSLSTGANTATSFNLASVRTSAPAMISLSSRRTHAGKISITTAKTQKMGVYKLASNLSVASSASVSILCGGQNMGKIRANGSISKNGVRYTLKSTATQTTLTLKALAGVIKTGKGALSGTANCDIFFGSTGNNVITAGKGRDVAVYTAAKWGSDTIKGVDGDMTILFSGIKASDVVANLKGKNMVITRKNDKTQKITVQNWNAATHKIVYGGTLTQFNKYVKEARPTAALKSQAFNEVWKKAGILA